MKKIAIFSGLKPIREIVDLREVLEARGHEVVLCNLSGVTVQNLADGSYIESLQDFDLVYYRTGFGEAGRLFLSQLLCDTETVFINPVLRDHPLCSNKIYQSLLATQAGITVPHTLFGRRCPFIDLQQSIGLPFIMKAAEGIQGANVYLIRNEADLQEKITETKGDVLFQKYIQNDGDYRVFVIGDTVHEIFKRIPQAGSFKANMSLGATGEAVADPVVREVLGSMALKIAGILNIEIGGIDIIRDSTDGEYYFIESNVNPGWKGLDQTLGTRTSDQVADYFESRMGL